MTKPADIQKPQPLVEKSKEADKNTLKQTAEINKDVAEQQTAATTKATTEEIKETQAIGTKYISNQILAEPIRVVSPESIINAAIAAVNVLGQSILNPIKDRLEVTAELSQNPSAINNNQITDCIDKASKKCTTIAQTHAKTLQLANGHVINGAFNTLINSANSIHIVSDTATVNRTPFFSLSTQDTSLQSQNSFNLITDFNFNQFKQDIKFVEGTKISQSQTSLNIATESLDEVSKYSSYTGVDSIRTMGKVNSVVADSEVNVQSGDRIVNASYGDYVTQANGNVAILSTKPKNLDIPVGASGDEEAENESPPTSISIMNISAEHSNTLVMSNQGILSSTTGNQFSLSADLNLTVGDKGAAMTSDKFSFFGNPNGGTFSFKGRTFIGKFSFPIIDLGQAEIVDIPSLPVLPSLQKQKLENCLPKGIKNPNTFPDTNPEQEPILTEGIPNAEVFNPNTFTFGNQPQSSNSNNEVQVKPPATPSANNKIELPKESGTFPNYDPNSESIFTAKLPPPSVSTDPKLNGSTAFINPITAANILVDRFSKESQDILSDLTFYEGITFDSFVNLLQEQDVLGEISASLQDTQGLITSDFIDDFIKPFLKEQNSSFDFSSILKYADFYIELTKMSVDVLENFELNIDNFKNLDQNKVQNILSLIQEYPKLKTQVLELVKTAKLTPAIGFFGGLRNVLNFASKGINVFKDVAKIPNLIKGGDFKKIFNFSKPFISKALKGTSFSKILDNSDLLDTLLKFGTDITKGDLTKLERDNLLKTTFDKVYNTEIKKVLEKKVSDFLGPKLDDAIPLVKNILCRVKLGCTIYPEDYIDEFSDILFNLTGDKNIQKATEIYQDLSQIIKASKDGDILGILTGDNVENLLTNILGENTAGNISKVLKVAKSAIGLYDSIKLLPDLLNLMNEYKIPAIDQVGIALNCLDLFNKAKGLFDSINGLGNNKQGASLVENAGRFTQFKNSLDSIDDSTLKDINNQINQELDEEIDLVEYKRTLNSNLVLDTCFRMPKLNIFQSEIEVVELRPQSIIFKLTNFDILKSDIKLLPKTNDLVQIRVQGFYSNSAREYLVPYQTDFQYTPSVYTFVISQYNLVNNLGIAYYDRAYSSIVLENTEGILYKFNTEAIGTTLSPDIVDSYILA